MFKPKGIDASVKDSTFDPERADLFECEESPDGYHFPCGICIHRERELDNRCARCKFYHF